MKRIGTVIAETKNANRPKNLYREFQQYGVFIAEQLEDTKHYSLYIKLCKEFPRSMIDEALLYAKGYSMAKSKGRVFMWRLKQLRTQAESEN